ncbi:nephronectin-like [Synchiropus picturatus]
MMVTYITLLLLWLCVRSEGRQVERNRADRLLLSEGLCRYGNSLECCWGWTQTAWGQCRPHCQQGCKHGECVAPDRCKCHPGFTGKACNQDLNECGLKPRPCKHRCMNTLGSYKCYCPDGFKMEPDGSCRNARTCFDANCQYGCEVVKGAVRCTCPSPGLRLGPDRRTCVDIDECMLGGAVCPRRRKCINTFGSFLCKCHLGFKLIYINGRYSCIDKDPRPFCTLNPASPKCRCKDGNCKAVPKVNLKPHRPRNTPTTVAPTTLTTVAMTTSTPAAPETPTTSVVSTALLTTTTKSILTSPDVTTAATHDTIPFTTPVTTTPAPVTTTTTLTTTALPLTTTTTPITTTAGLATTSVPVATTTALVTAKPVTTLPATSHVVTTALTSSPAMSTTTATVTTSTYTSIINTTPEATNRPSDTTVPATTGRTRTTTLDNRINKETTHRQRGDVHIPRHDLENQVWDFDIELGNTADDARDDPGAGGRHCSFNRGICHWMSDRDGDLSWETVDSPAGGRYLSVQELKPGQRSVRGARLVVQVDPEWHSGEMCFHFSHWLTGHHVGVLQLFMRKRGPDHRYSPALWSRTGGHGWRHTQVTVAAQTVDRVLIKAERRRGRRGQIAVDDVTLNPGACR